MEIRPFIIFINLGDVLKILPAMKDLGAPKQILGIRITRERKNQELTLSQSEYIEKVLKRFNMQNAKPISIPLASHFKLSKEVCPKT